MADSPDLDTDEYLILNEEILSMLMTPVPLERDLQNALNEINENLLEQQELKGNTKIHYKNLKKKVEAASEISEALKMESATVQEEVNANKKILEKLNSQEIKDPYRYESKLYQAFTKIKWDTECPENKVAGVIGGKTPSTFQLDEANYSKSFITDHLWSLVKNAAEL